MWTLDIVLEDDRGKFTVFTTHPPTRFNCIEVAKSFKGDFEAHITNRNNQTEIIKFVDGMRSEDA